MRRRSNMMVLLGIAFFIVGVAAVYLVAGDDDDGGGDSGGGTVTVVVANKTIGAGSLGADLVKDKAFREIEVPATQRLPDAAGSIQQLANARFILGFAKDQQITLGGIQPLTSNIEVPEGYEAVAVQLDFVGAGAGYVTTADRINIYAVNSVHGNKPVPRTELLLSNVKILDISLDVAARTSTAADDTGTVAERSGASKITYLLALKTADVEKIIFQTSFENLYATLVAEDAPAPGDTSGVDTGTVLSGAPSVGPKEN